MQISGKKILLTGGCGFIGNTFTKELLKQDVKELLVLDKMTYVSDRKFHDENGIKVEVVDIASEEAFNLVKEFKPDILVNMAAESHVDVSIKNPNVFLQSNVSGTTNLLNAALKLETLPLFFQISTDEVYGDKSSGWSLEDDPRLASSPYSASKVSAEMFVEAYGRTYGLPYLITRSSNNYGPYQYPEKFIPKAITNLLAGKKVPVYGDGKQERDWIHVQDNCRGLLAAMNLSYETGNDSAVFNIGEDKTTTNLEIIQKLCFILDKDPDEVIQFVTDRPGHDRRYAISTSLINSYTDWKPKISLDLGLYKTVEWYKERK